MSTMLVEVNLLEPQILVVGLGFWTTDENLWFTQLFKYAPKKLKP